MQEQSLKHDVMFICFTSAKFLLWNPLNPLLSLECHWAGWGSAYVYFTGNCGEMLRKASHTTCSFLDYWITCLWSYSTSYCPNYEVKRPILTEGSCVPGHRQEGNESEPHHSSYFTYTQPAWISWLLCTDPLCPAHADWMYSSRGKNVYVLVILHG